MAISIEIKKKKKEEGERDIDKKYYEAVPRTKYMYFLRDIF